MKGDLEEEEQEDEEVLEIKPVELPSNSWDIYNVEQLKLYFKGPNPHFSLIMFFKRPSTTLKAYLTFLSIPGKKNAVINFALIRRI